MTPARIAGLLLLAAILSPTAFAHGLGLLDSPSGACAMLESTSIRVSVENQVAMVTTTQAFRNQASFPRKLTFAFPVPEGASPITLRWKRGNTEWRTASYSGDTTSGSGSGGGKLPAPLMAYLGKSPMYFPLDSLMTPGEIIMVELTYVRFLDYRFGSVSFLYPGGENYPTSLISTNLETSFSLTLTSERTIGTIASTSHSSLSSTNSGGVATISGSNDKTLLTKSIAVNYSLSLAQLGMFGHSTVHTDSLGYFAFVVEPDPSTTAVIQKNFILVMDVSGSMGGVRINQARDAAKYIIRNLNAGDRFNIVTFSDVISSFHPTLRDYSVVARDEALTFIDGVRASGSTDLEGGLARAIPQFDASDPADANIVILLSDGAANIGIIKVEDIIASVQSKVQAINRQVYLFTFGIGASASADLLTQLALQNGGMAEFIESEEVESRITEFYNSIRNPVLTNPVVSFSSDKIKEVYPVRLPNLYKGKQIIITGQYEPTPPVTVTFSGTAFGSPVAYQYVMNLATDRVPDKTFVPKLWAKQKIDYLFVLYNAEPATSSKAKEYKAEIVRLSKLYGVITLFTSFSDDDPPVLGVEERTALPAVAGFALDPAAPNPFLLSTTFSLRVTAQYHGPLRMRIYSAAGVLVREVDVLIAGPGIYRMTWDGRDEAGQLCPAGTYLYVMDVGTALLSGRVVVLR